MQRVYLDYNGTTPLEPSVLEVITSALKDSWGNPSSSCSAGKKAKHVIEDARKEVARMVGASYEDIIFTSGGTESNNWVIRNAVEHFHRNTTGRSDSLNYNGDSSVKVPHIITTNIEHDSIKMPLSHLLQREEIEVTYVPVSKSKGYVEVDDIVNAIRPNTCLVTVMLANNVTGVIQPVTKICQALKANNKTRSSLCQILLHTDAAQAIGKIPVNVKDLGVDFLTIVGHKYYGPRIGALYVKNLHKDTPLYPLLFGGCQEHGYRSGTENTGMIAGLGKASQLVADNYERYQTHLKDIRDYLAKKLKKEFGDKICFNPHYPDDDMLPNTLNFSFLGANLEGYNVLGACRSTEGAVGSNCHEATRPSPILHVMGFSEEVAANSIRFSVGRETSKADVDVVVDDLRQAIQSLLGHSPKPREAEQTRALDYSMRVASDAGVYS